eukprot:6839544-Heterocapsa_arctica.AAC.1
MGFRLICYAKCKAFCEEFHGDSEDARRPLKRFEKPSKTCKDLETIYACLCTPVGRTENPGI